MFHTLFLDLDNTLYPKSSGLMDAIRDRIISYMHERLGLEDPEILAIRKYSLQKYGTTLLGLKERFEIDEFEYLDYVHNINLADYLENDIHLKTLIESYPQRKIIFTNSDKNHVERILKFLNINDLIETVVDIHSLMPNLKPHKEAFIKALEIAGLSSWEGCAFIDDYPANIDQAREMGIYSILIDEDTQYQDYLKISSIYDLPSLIPSKS
jgi:putative hydrolase of the HAD superfamily